MRHTAGVSTPAPDALPTWSPGTVAVLSTAGGEPHAIPVSTAVRADDRRVLIALARRRESLARLRADPRVALTLLTGEDIALTAHCRARVVADPLADNDRVCAVSLEVVRLQDHRQPRFLIDDGVSWHWTDPDAERQDAQIRGALAELAGRPA